MKTIRSYLTLHWRALIIICGCILALILLYGYRLGTLVTGMSQAEYSISVAPIGWHGIWHQPLYLPLELVRSLLFKIRPIHGSFIVRVPDVVFGLIAIAAIAILLRLWHGTRSALLGTALFATASWTLHVSRLASNDSLYLAALPILLLSHALLLKHHSKKYVSYGSLMLWGLLLYIPGLVWFVLLNGLLQRHQLRSVWHSMKSWWQRALWLLVGLIWLPLLIIDFMRNMTTFRVWLGLPATYARPAQLLKQFAAVFVHLFIRGPKYPQLWLERTPVLDIFTLSMCVVGIYFYIKHYQAQRARLLGCFFILGAVLIALGGAVPLSLLVPILFILATAGIAYLLHEWLQVFPINPLARNIGVTIIVIAVAVSCLYNLRAYFVVWPHDTATSQLFYLKD
jgi:hypothetical protein